MIGVNVDCLAIIQARMGSTRLPGKILKDLAGKPVLQHVYDRVKKARLINEIIVATTIGISDLPVVKYCSSQGVRVFAGSEDDVLDRFYQIAKLLQPKTIVRITADCPVIDPEIIDQVIDLHKKSDADYTSNCMSETFPDGLDVEIVKYSALEKAWNNAKLVSEREHVTPYIKSAENGFKIEEIKSEINYHSKRWTLDNEEDYLFLQKVLNHFKEEYFGMNQLLEFLESNSELEEINSDITRNEGYQKSIKEDRLN